jgi:hypothetical protein
MPVLGIWVKMCAIFMDLSEASEPCNVFPLVSVIERHQYYDIMCQVHYQAFYHSNFMFLRGLSLDQ